MFGCGLFILLKGNTETSRRVTLVVVSYPTLWKAFPLLHHPLTHPGVQAKAALTFSKLHILVGVLSLCITVPLPQHPQESQSQVLAVQDRQALSFGACATTFLTRHMLLFWVLRW